MFFFFFFLLPDAMMVSSLYSFSWGFLPPDTVIVSSLYSFQFWGLFFTGLVWRTTRFSKDRVSVVSSLVVQLCVRSLNNMHDAKILQHFFFFF